MKNYDTFIIGELCIDEVVGFDGTSEWSIGGAVVYSSYSALAGGNRVGILIKSSAKDKMMPYIPSELISFISSIKGRSRLCSASTRPRSVHFSSGETASGIRVKNVSKF